MKFLEIITNRGEDIVYTLNYMFKTNIVYSLSHKGICFLNIDKQSRRFFIEFNYDDFNSKTNSEIINNILSNYEWIY